MNLYTGDGFAGFGGMTAGMIRAGMDVRWACNHNADAVFWSAQNWKVPHIQQDLTECDWARMERVEWAHLSPECPWASTAGRPARQGTGGNSRPDKADIEQRHAKSRNTIWAVLACADGVRPRTITIENSTELYRWSTLGAWTHVLEDLGYVVTQHTLNAKDFGGGQDRPRAIITARQGEALELEVPTGVAHRTIGECLDKRGFRWSTIASKSERMRWRIRKAQKEAGSHCFWNNVSEAAGRSLDDCFPTATTKSGSQWNMVKGNRIRVMNPSEIARSMGFGRIKLPSKRGLAGKLLGNAMDVDLSASIAEQVGAA